MRRLVAAMTALLGLVMLAGSFNLLLSPITVLFAELPLGEAAVAMVLSVLPAAASIALAVFLIRRRERIAAWYVPEGEDAPAVPAENLLRVGLVLLGLYLVVQAIPDLLATATAPVVNWLQARADTVFGEPYAAYSSWRWLIQNVPRIAANLASLAIGCVLILKREPIVARILREGPPAKDDAPEVALPQCESCGAPYDPAEYDGGAAEARCMTCKEPLGLPRS